MATNDLNSWMSQVVVITQNNSILQGTYDGYGRVETGSETFEDAVGWDNEVYHKACWILEGRPTTFTAKSDHSADQGWFFDDDDYMIPEPKGMSDIGVVHEDVVDGLVCPKCDNVDVDEFNFVEIYKGTTGHRVKRYDQETNMVTIHDDARWDETLDTIEAYVECNNCSHMLELNQNGLLLEWEYE
jgi:hypothetical protein